MLPLPHTRLRTRQCCSLRVFARREASLLARGTKMRSEPILAPNPNKKNPLTPTKTGSIHPPPVPATAPNRLPPPLESGFRAPSRSYLKKDRLFAAR